MLCDRTSVTRRENERFTIDRLATMVCAYVITSKFTPSNE